MVQFVPLNLLNNHYPAAGNDLTNMDVILCRNVTIYFDRPTTMEIVNRLFNVLVPDGWLVVGHSEPQPGVYDAFETCNFDNAIFYRKPATTRKPAPPVPVFVAPELPVRAHVAPVVPPTPKPVAESTDLWMQARAAADGEYWDEAFHLLEQAEQHDVLQPQIHYLRGLIFMQMGHRGDAQAALRQAVYCDPTFALAHYSLGDLYAMTGESTEAQRYWQRAQKALKGLHPETLLPYADDLTVEMLGAILNYRLKQS
jgi:chemotaxis protein methyltransferase CheR